MISPEGKILYAYSDSNAEKHIENTLAVFRKWREEHKPAAHASELCWEHTSDFLRTAILTIANFTMFPQAQADRYDTLANSATRG